MHSSPPISSQLKTLRFIDNFIRDVERGFDSYAEILEKDVADAGLRRDLREDLGYLKKSVKGIA